MLTDPYPDSDPPSLEIEAGQLYVSAEQLARRFGVGVKWVNTRKAHLGAIRLSDSANSKLRYHLPTADAYMHSRMLKPVVKPRRPRAKRSAGGGQGLLEFV